MIFEDYSEGEIQRWLLLRAIEWAALPAFISQIVVPVWLLFSPWYYVLLTVFAAGVIWCLFRYSFVNVGFARVACTAVAWLKWPASLGSSILLFARHRPLTAAIALAWPLIAGFIGIPGKVGVIELAFAEKIGLVPRGTRDEVRSDRPFAFRPVGSLLLVPLTALNVILESGFVFLSAVSGVTLSTPSRIVFGIMFVWTLVDAVLTFQDAPTWWLGLILSLFSLTYNVLFFGLVASLWGWLSLRRKRTQEAPAVKRDYLTTIETNEGDVMVGMSCLS